jgi:serine/threonine-protein kinase
MESGRVPEARPEPAPSVPRRPTVERFGRYYLLERIGKGGMAEVYRAVSLGLEGFRRMFVVKRILAEKSRSPEFVRMFCEEARISALLHHPNVVQVYDFGHVGGSYFLAMEYLLGRDLASVMRVLRASNLSVPPTLAAFIGQQVALGLGYAHALRGSNGAPLGIVHRDVTPSNIMLLHAGGVKILDFGIAKATAAGTGQPSQVSGGLLKGKIGYLSPEQAREGEADARSDLFALGVTLWEMLAGKRLFAGGNELETLKNVLEKPVPAPSTLRPGVPPELDRVVLKALERDRDARYQTADEMARDLEQILRDGRYESQSLRRLLDELFGEESSSASADVPDLPEMRSPSGVPGGDEQDADAAADGAAATVPTVAPSIEIEIAEASAPRVARTRTLAPPFGVITTGDMKLPAPALPRRRVRALVWAAFAVAAVVAAAPGLGGRKHRVAAPAPAPVAVTAAQAAPAAPPAALAAAAPATVKLDLDSSPRGASVTGPRGEPLGATPVIVTVPRGAEPRAFTIARPGYQSATYQLRPDHDAVAFIELARDHAAGGAHRPHRRAARDLGDSLTINPF